MATWQTFLWACKHFYSKPISCKMLEKEQERARRPDLLWANSPGVGVKTPLGASCPAPGWARAIHRQTKLVKWEGRRGSLGSFLKGPPTLNIKPHETFHGWNQNVEGLLPWPRAVHTSYTQNLEAFPSSSQLPGVAGRAMKLEMRWPEIRRKFTQATQERQNPDCTPPSSLMQGPSPSGCGKQGGTMSSRFGNLGCCVVAILCRY